MDRALLRAEMVMSNAFNSRELFGGHDEPRPFGHHQGLCNGIHALLNGESMLKNGEVQLETVGSG